MGTVDLVVNWAPQIWNVQEKLRKPLTNETVLEPVCHNEITVFRSRVESCGVVSIRNCQRIYH